MHNTKKTPLQDNILRLAQENGLSIAEVNRRAGLSPAAIRNILYGKSRDPQGNTLAAIARVFNITVDALRGDGAIKPTIPEENIYDPATDNTVSAGLNAYIIEHKITLTSDKARRFKKVLYDYAKKTGHPVDKALIEWYLQSHN